MESRDALEILENSDELSARFLCCIEAVAEIGLGVSAICVSTLKLRCSSSLRLPASTNISSRTLAWSAKNLISRSPRQLEMELLSSRNCRPTLHRVRCKQANERPLRPVIPGTSSYLLSPKLLSSVDMVVFDFRRRTNRSMDLV